MPKLWDEMMKRLIEMHPQDFVSWVSQDAQVEHILKQELQQTVYADSLIKVSFKDKPAILHFEYQTRNDARMGERALLYNTLASYTNEDIPVYSHVLYLRPSDHIVQSPFVRIFPDGKEITRFHYNVIKLWEMPAEDLLNFPHPGLLPLVLLAKGGTEQDVVEEMIQKIADTGESELLSASYTLGGLVFKAPEQHNWFKRRFHMFEDILEESWTYQEMKQEITQKIEQLELHRLRTMLATVAQKRFPKTARLAKGMGSTINDPSILSELIINISTAQTLEEATDVLLAAGEMSENNSSSSV